MSQEVSPPQRHRDSIFRESRAESYLNRAVGTVIGLRRGVIDHAPDAVGVVCTRQSAWSRAAAKAWLPAVQSEMGE
jgi:hypothetical protein